MYDINNFCLKFPIQGWMNELSSPYDPENYHISQTHSLYVRLDQYKLRLSRPKQNIARRAMFDEPAVKPEFIHQRHYDMRGSKVRPKKKKKKGCLFALFRPTQNIGKIRVSFFCFCFCCWCFLFFFDSQLCIFKQKISNELSEYILPVPKWHFNQIQWNTSPSTRIKPILGIYVPRNAHTWIILHFSYVQI